MESTVSSASSSSAPVERPLSLEEYKRYGRQMIMPDFGLPGQLKLKAAKVAVIGAGGLGCPVLQYLVGAGVGTVAIFDHDTVSISNLHRQILHTTDRVGTNKAESASISLHAMNPHVQLLPIAQPITPANALSLLETYQIIIDCTDRPLTRYLLSDVSVRLSIPLVSGAAISQSGQWAVYSGVTAKGKRRACYRCIWPDVIPGTSGRDRCDEVGVLGPVTGIVGSGMAGEVMRLLLGTADEDPVMHFLRLGGQPLVRTVRMRGPRKGCLACGEDAKITDDFGAMDYEKLYADQPGDVLKGEGPVERLTAMEFAKLLTIREGSERHGRLIIDTRPAVEYGICALPITINIPFSSGMSSSKSVKEAEEVIFICRRGQDSHTAAIALAKSGKTKVKDVIGGLEAWSREVDPTLPIY